MAKNILVYIDGTGNAGGILPTVHNERGGFVMALSKTSICDFSWKARDFSLKGVDGKTYTLADVRGPKGTLVVFICNHCPYVKASIDRIVVEAKALREIGIGTIAIMPNDTETYREDSFDNMKAFAAKHGFPFPYVIDETQDVARAYDAQCTPDCAEEQPCPLCAKSGLMQRSKDAFGHLVGCLHESFRDCEARGFGRLKIDDQQSLK
jgi:peroxiredoxin